MQVLWIFVFYIRKQHGSDAIPSAKISGTFLHQILSSKIILFQGTSNFLNTWVTNEKLYHVKPERWDNKSCPPSWFITRI